jgi:hypothetical protein
MKGSVRSMYEQYLRANPFGLVQRICYDKILIVQLLSATSDELSTIVGAAAAGAWRMHCTLADAVGSVTGCRRPCAILRVLRCDLRNFLDQSYSLSMRGTDSARFNTSPLALPRRTGYIVIRSAADRWGIPTAASGADRWDNEKRSASLFRRVKPCLPCSLVRIRK